MGETATSTGVARVTTVQTLAEKVGEMTQLDISAVEFRYRVSDLLGEKQNGFEPGEFEPWIGGRNSRFVVD